MEGKKDGMKSGEYIQGIINAMRACEESMARYKKERNAGAGVGSSEPVIAEENSTVKDDILKI